jgi:hypothetical protein
MWVYSKMFSLCLYVQYIHYKLNHFFGFQLIRIRAHIINHTHSSVRCNFRTGKIMSNAFLSQRETATAGFLV